MTAPCHRWRYSRRVFLQDASALVAGSLSVPTIIPARVLAGPDRSAASNQIAVGYIGVGHRGPQLMDLPGDTRIVAVCDVYRRHAEAAARTAACDAYDDYRRLLDRQDVDAVIVATPEHWHALPAIHACQAGKDVYCEKPLALTVHEGQAIVQAARKYDRVFQVGTHQRSMQSCRMGCELVRSGRIGKVHTVIVHNHPSPWECALPGQPVPDGLDWDRWCGPTAPRPYHADIFQNYLSGAKPGWTCFRTYAGGRMCNWGVHAMDMVQWALGMEETGPVEIWTEGPAFHPPRTTAPEAPDASMAACCIPSVYFRYANGVLVRHGTGSVLGGVFLGEHGSIVVERGFYRVDPPDLAPPSPKDSHEAGTKNHLANWIECIRSRARPVADVEIAHRATNVCHLGNIARWTGRKLQWDPAKEVFPHDDQANQYLSRPSRSAYQLPVPL